MSDKIDAIRARHNDAAWRYYELPSQMHDDRALLLAEVDRHRAEIERLRAEIERLRERLLQEQAALVLDEIGAALERERVMRSALTDMLSGWRYIRDTYGDLAGVGWDRVEQKARNALEGKP